MKFNWNEVDFSRIGGLIMSFWGLLCRTCGIIFRFFVDFVSDLLFGLVNRNRSEQLPAIRDLVLLETASTLAAKIRNQKLKSKDVVESYIARIKEVNPFLNAVVEDNFKDAIADAQRVDKLIASGVKTEKQLEEETPLLGVPFTTKDSVSVKGLHTTSGLWIRKDIIMDEDAAVIKLMRKAGAILLGHTNVSELCMWWESYNNVYGTTNNPYNTTRIVGGSSGGEGSIIGGAGSVIGIGSDVGGSIRIPCFFNGIFGHKSTTGIVENSGQIPVAHGEISNYLSTGPMCRYATDLMLVFKVVAAPNLHKLKLDTKVDIGSLRYFYMENDGGSTKVSKVHPDIQKAMKKVVYYLETGRKVKCTKVDIKNMKHSVDVWASKMASAGGPSFCEDLTEGKGKVNAPLEFIKWLFWCSKHTLPAIMLGILESITPKDDNSINIMHGELKREIEGLLGDDGVLLYPTHPRPAPYHYQPLLMPFNFAYTAIFNVLGFPCTHCPLGLNDEGLPVGIQVVANKYNDHLCLAVACELERAFGGWVSPSIIL